MFLPDSRTSPKIRIPLAAFENRQLPIIQNLGLGDTYNVRFAVRVVDGSGKVTAGASVVDQHTHDPTFIPAQ